MRRPTLNRPTRESGFSLLETLLAIGIFLVGALGLLGAITSAVLMNASHCTQGTEATEYASAKMEDLMVLPFSDTGLGGMDANTKYPSAGNLVSGICKDPSYCDYVAVTNGTVTIGNSTANAAYMRQWEIDVDSTGKIKTVTVLVTSRQLKTKLAPSATLISQRTDY